MPTYHHIGDHTETLQVDFDPAIVPLEALLTEFWARHDASAPAWSRQYMSAIWVADAAQEAAAKASRDRFERALGRPVLTEIRRLERFHPAEAYHHKYRLRGDRVLFAEFREMYPDDAGLIASTAAARVNGYVAGCGTPAGLAAEIASYGLSEHGRARLAEVVAARVAPKGAAVSG